MQCFWCLTEDCQLCSSCQLVASCSIHWAIHCSEDSSVCFPFKVSEDKVFGRRLVATREIVQSEIILTDSPVAVGPVHSTTPVCLECYQLLNRVGHVECPGCGFPMCSEECFDGPVHSLECQVFSSKGFRPKIERFDIPAVEYQVIMVLRILLNNDCLDIDRTNLLTEHIELLGQAEREVYQENVVNVITKKLGLKHWSQEDIFKYISIIRTNACAMNVGEDKGNIRILHPTLSTMNHSCRVNTRAYTRPGYVVCIRAMKNIQKDEEIFLKYTNFFAGQLERKEQLEDNWHFSCICPRCQDPSDFGSNFNSLLCHQCPQKGLMVPDCPASRMWKCSLCAKSLSRDQVRQMEVRLDDEIENISGNVDKMEKLLETNLMFFHTNHHLLVKIKVQIITGFGKIMESQAKAGKSWSLKLVKRVVELSRQVIEVLDKIEPGLSDTRCSVLSKMVAPQLMFLKFNFQKGRMSKDQVKSELETLLGQIKDVRCHLDVFLEESENKASESMRNLYKDTESFYNTINQS